MVRERRIWQRFGVWLLLGLEFELAADIIGTVVSPTWRDIGELAAIAAIRTFLNYFLEKDVERADEARPDVENGRARGGRRSLVSGRRIDGRVSRAGFVHVNEAGHRTDAAGARAHADGVGPHGHVADLLRIHHL